MSKMSVGASRLAYVSIALSALSVTIWIPLFFFERFVVDTLHADEVLYPLAVFSGVISGVIAISLTVSRSLKHRNFPTLIRISLALGVIVFVWNAYIWWLFLSAFTNCPNGVC